jgi:two-component system cell cycle response regulator
MQGDSMQKKSILIVDDDPLNLKLLVNKLSREEYRILTASDGKEAVEQAQKELPDLILLDIMMPVMDGYQATETLKNNPETKDIPIILITALDGTEEKLRGLEAGSDEFLNKPVNTAELLARVKSLLRMKMYKDQLKSRAQLSDSVVYQAPLQQEINLPTILLVEDEELHVRLIQTYLSADAYRIEVVKTGEDCLSRVLNDKVDLVLLDILLPGMNGFEVVRRLREIEESKNLQVVALTNLPDMESKIKGIELGADDYLVKPINRHELRVRIRSLIKKKAYLDTLQTEYDSAVHSAITDRLTGLYNRAYFEHFIQMEIKRAERHYGMLGLIMMDIDDFKYYNDHFGHLAGDEILRSLGKLIRQNTREIDLAARYGGEEFIIVLPSTPPEGAVVVAERIRRIVSEHCFLPQNDCEKRLTVSAGVAAYPAEGRNVEELIFAADSLLYRAKAEGKNRVCFQQAEAARAAECL